ncbi:MAG TPA: HU family DNA-binding protein, partial [Bryobacteraceae bacterium]|nr:HU family DNA-binding protein [Bryobacteraceae bacterium]
MDRLIQRLAEMSKTSPAKAADRLDSVVHEIIKQLRDGEAAVLPGLGKFTPGQETLFQPEGTNVK